MVSRKSRAWLVVVVGLIILVVVGLVLRGRGRPARGEGPASWALGAATVGNVEVTVSGSGAMQPGLVEDVKTEVNGQVVRVLVGNGDTVEAGQVILELDNEGALLAWEQARLTLDDELERLEEIYEGTASVSDTAIRAAELRVEQARLALAAEEELVAELTVKAPAAGRVGTVNVEVGDEVGPGAVLLTVREGPVAQATLGVPEDQVGSIVEGTPASLILAPLPEVHVVRVNLGETSVYGLREGDAVVATLDGQWVSSYSPVVRGTVVDISHGGAFFSVTCRLPGLSDRIPAGANVSFMQIYPSGAQASASPITASGKVSVEVDVWGLADVHLDGEALAAHVVTVGEQGAPGATGEVVYPVTVEADEYPAAALAGMSAHVMVYPEDGEPQDGVTTVELPQTAVTTAAGGEVVAVHVQDGGEVTEDQTMIVLANDNLLLRLDQARNDLAASEESLGDLAEPEYTDRERRSQEIRVRQAELALEQREREANGLKVRAPGDGRVASLSDEVTVGQDLPLGFLICRVLNYQSMELTVQVDELEVDLVASGMEVEVEVDALPGQTFAGRVVEVSQEGQHQQGVSRFAVTIGVEASPRLRSQMTATATIFVAAKQDVLLIPAEAVAFLGEGEAEVFVVGPNGRPEAKQIEIGLYNNAEVEVVAGLSEGDRVVTGEISDQDGFNWRNPRPGRIR